MDEYKVITGFPLERAIAFDIETTGLSSDRDEILSIAVVDGSGSVLFDSLIRPTRKKSWPEAQEVNHISPSMVKDAPTIAQCRGRLAEIFTTDRLFVTYNGQFDFGFLESAKVLGDLWKYEEFDVMREYARVHGADKWENSGKFKYSKLVECARSYHYEFDAHNALSDSLATLYCFKALVHDKAYVEEVFRKKYDRSRAAGTSHTKKNIEEIKSLVGDRKLAEFDGEFVKRMVTSGPKKGQFRYHVMIDDREVGRLTQLGMDDAAKFYGAQDYAQLPDSAICGVRLYHDGERYSGKAYFVLDSDLFNALKERANAPFVQQTPIVPTENGFSSGPKEMSSSNQDQAMSYGGLISLVITVACIIFILVASFSS